MFDDQVTKTNPPTNLPTEPDDMFAGVEKEGAELNPVEKTPDALGAGLLKKKDTVAPNISAAPTVAPSLYEVKQPVLGKVLLFFFIAVILGAVGFGGWYAYGKFIKAKPVATPVIAPTTTEQQPIVETSSVIVPVEENITTTIAPTSSDVTAKMNNDKILFGESVDSDKDGLDDVREKELGTDPYNADTDKDGLNDGDEVIIWKTNPLNPDTDGDSYPDGQEVRNAYNPLGPGKLFNMPAGVSTSTVKVSTSTKTTLPKATTSVKNKK